MTFSLFSGEFKKGFSGNRKFILAAVLFLFAFLFILSFETLIYFENDIIEQLGYENGTQSLQETDISEEDLTAYYTENLNLLKAQREEYLKENNYDNFDTTLYIIGSNIAILEYLIENGTATENSYYIYSYNGAIRETFADFVDFFTSAMSSVIIVFAVIFASSVFAEEYKTGTMRLILTRPYFRKDILRAKVLSVYLYAFILLIVSFIGACIYGGIRFKDNATFMAVFNSSNVFFMGGEQVILSFVFIALNTMFFVQLSLWLSVVSKSTALTLTLSFILFFAGSLWKTVTGYAYIGYASYLTNMDLGAFFTVTGPLLKGMNFYASFALTVVYCLFFNATQFIVFNRRDI